MTQPELNFAVEGVARSRPAAPKVSKLDRVKQLFESQPNTWIDGREIATVGGAYAWRTRVSECRTRYRMTIDNRERWGTSAHDFTISEYRFRPTPEGA